MADNKHTKKTIDLDVYGNTLVISSPLMREQGIRWDAQHHVLGKHKYCGGTIRAIKISFTHGVLGCDGGCNQSWKVELGVTTLHELQNHCVNFHNALP